MNMKNKNFVKVFTALGTIAGIVTAIVGVKKMKHSGNTDGYATVNVERTPVDRVQVDRTEVEFEK